MESHLTLVLSESGKCSLRVPTSAFGPQRRWEQTVRPPPPGVRRNDPWPQGLWVQLREAFPTAVWRPGPSPKLL